jgi:hypothetical protein
LLGDCAIAAAGASAHRVTAMGSRTARRRPIGYRSDASGCSIAGVSGASR